MKNKIQIFAGFAFYIAFASLYFPLTKSNASAPSPLVVVKPMDSLRVGGVIKAMKALSVTLRDTIIPKLEGEQKKSLMEGLSRFEKLLKATDTQFKDTLLTDFTRLSEQEKNNLKKMEKAVASLKNDLPGKSVSFHQVALAHIPVYKAVQEMNPDGKIPLLATYAFPYDPNTTDNNQVLMVGAYLNFYLEYRIKVGGIVMGPDIVDPERIVFTFPEKLLEGISEPTFIEVHAAPKKQVGGPKSMNFQEHPEQATWLLVYPRKK